MNKTWSWQHRGAVDAPDHYRREEPDDGRICEPASDRGRISRRRGRKCEVKTGITLVPTWRSNFLKSEQSDRTALESRAFHDECVRSRWQTLG
jgi:hypothetical protein